MAPSKAATALAVATISCLVLFQELALIRWLPSQVRVLAYFPNLVLISAFLGLGIGALRARATSLSWLWPASLIVIVAAARGGSQIVFTQDRGSEYLRLLYFDLPADAPRIEAVHLPIVVAFVLSTATFAPLGQLLAARLDDFRARGRALHGYAWDIAGSIVGVVAFTLVSFAELRPFFWFAIVVGLGVVVVLREARRAPAALGAIALVAVLVIVRASESADVYSPYYAISTQQKGAELHVLTNGSLHQVAIDMRATPSTTPSTTANAALAADVQRLDEIRAGYHAPYRKLGRPIRRALVLGAGSGNDVCTLLDEGALHVDAVEIDPQILEIGRTRHPCRPYADATRVTAHNTDARGFLHNRARTNERYDVIVFGTLDSMTQLSALANVRLDNFVYTRESIEAARHLLTPDGALIMFFMSGAHYVDEHMLVMITAAFGHEPIMELEYRHLFNRVFLTGPAFAAGQPPAPPSFDDDSTLMPTDDWPYLYLAERGVSGFYVTTMIVLALLSLTGVLWASPALRRSARRGDIDVQMLLLGAAFFLVETNLITSMGLVWGSTWLTSAVVFGAVLVTLLAATLTSAWRPLPLRAALAVFVATLVVTAFVPRDVLIGHDVPLRLLLSALFVGVPLFFASCSFGVAFGTRADAGVALGWNLLGAVVGGLVELFAMWTGHGAMALVAAVFALLVLLLVVRADARATVSAR